MLTNASKTPFRILIPVLNQRLVGDLLTLAQAVAGERGGEAIILGVAEVQDSSFSTGRPLARAYRTLLNYMPPATPDLARFPAGTQPIVVHTRVKVAHNVAQGIVDAAIEERADLLLMPWKGYSQHDDAIYGRATDEVILNAPCDLILCHFGAGGLAAVGAMLLAVRGGPYAEFALQVGQSLMPVLRATLTVLHSGVSAPAPTAPGGWDEPYLEFGELLRGSTHPYREVSTVGPDPATAVLREVASHQMVIMGASGTLYRGAAGQTNLTQQVAAAVQEHDLAMLVARTRQPLELVHYQRSRSTLNSTPHLIGGWGDNEQVDFALDAPEANPQARLRPVVEHWAAEHSYEATEFADHARLANLKQRHGLHVSLCLNFSGTSPKHLAELLKGVQKGVMEEARLVDEIVVLDGGDGSVAELASRHGFSGYLHRDILPEITLYGGAGAMLWKSAAVSSGDLIVWHDVQAGKPTTMSVANLLGPLLEEADLKLIIGRGSQRPTQQDYFPAATLWRLPDLVAAIRRGEAAALRHLCARFFYQLAGLLEPTSRDLAACRDLLTGLPLVAGPVGSVGLLLDTISRYGLAAIGQVEVARPMQADGPHVLATALRLLNLFAYRQPAMLGESGRTAALAEMQTLYDLLMQGQRLHSRHLAHLVDERELESLELPPLGRLH